MINDQISVLNRAYESMGITFKLVSTRRYQSSGWFYDLGPGIQEQTDMKTALRQGQRARDLNLYSVG